MASMDKILDEFLGSTTKGTIRSSLRQILMKFLACSVGGYGNNAFSIVLYVYVVGMCTRTC